MFSVPLSHQSLIFAQFHSSHIEISNPSLAHRLKYLPHSFSHNARSPLSGCKVRCRFYTLSYFKQLMNRESFMGVHTFFREARELIH